MSITFKDVHLRLGRLTLELNLTLDRNITALFGPSGAGKTTVLELVAGLRVPDSGLIELDGIPLTDVSRGIFVPARKRVIGYVPQDLALFPHLSVRQNIGYGAKKQTSSRPKVSREKLCHVLEIEPLQDRMPNSLSGGEKQRVAFARALLASPRLLLLDEPMASLDQPLKDRILPYLERIREEFAIPILYVTHSASEVRTFCDDVAVLREGKCVAHGEADALFIETEEKVYRWKG